MCKGFTLVEVLVSLSLLLLAVLASARIMVAVLAQTRSEALRFRLLEKLDDYRNYLYSRPAGAAELEPGPHARREGRLLVEWSVEQEEPDLQRVRLRVSCRPLAQSLSLLRPRLILGVRP